MGRHLNGWSKFYYLKTRLTKPEEDQPTNKKDGASSSKSDTKKVADKKLSPITKFQQNNRKNRKQTKKIFRIKQVDKKPDIKIKTSNEATKLNSQTKRKILIRPKLVLPTQPRYRTIQNMLAKN